MLSCHVGPSECRQGCWQPDGVEFLESTGHIPCTSPSTVLQARVFEIRLSRIAQIVMTREARTAEVSGLICARQVGIRCVRLEGSMSMEARNRMIDAFTNDPAVTVFLMSLKAGGVALNLTAASHVMLMDPWCALCFSGDVSSWKCAAGV